MKPKLLFPLMIPLSYHSLSSIAQKAIRRLPVCFSPGLLLIAIVAANAQAPNIEWQKNFGGTDSEFANDIVQTADHGYIVVGAANSFDGDVVGNHSSGQWTGDGWIIKLDSVGEVLWKECLGGAEGEEIRSVKQCSRGGYIIAGNSSLNGGQVNTIGVKDYWVVRLDETGNIIWQKTLGGTDDDLGYDVEETADKGFLVGGYTYSHNDGDVSGNHANPNCSILLDYWVVKLDSSGILQWQKCYGGTLQESAASLKVTTDHGFVVFGSTDSNDGDVSGNHTCAYGNSWDYWIVKADSMGNIQWQKCLGGANEDYGNSVQQTFDGGYIVTGITWSNDGDVTGNHSNNTGDYWVVKLNSNGAIQWQKALGSLNSEQAYSIQQTSDSGYVVAGYNYSSNNGDVSGSHGDADFWVVKLDISGMLVWEKSIGGTGPDIANSVKQTSDGGFIVAGSSDSHDGDATGNNGYYDFWVVKLSSAATGIQNIYGDEKILSAFPNPFTSTTTISFSLPQDAYATIDLYDVTGRKLKTLFDKNVTERNQEVNFSRDQLNSGIYLLQLRMNDEVVTKKLVIE